MTASDSSAGPRIYAAAARASSVFERVAGLALGGVHTDRHGIMSHARADQSHRGDHGFGAGFAGEFPVRGLGVGDRADRFRDQRGGRLDRIRVGLRPDPDRAQFCRVDPGPFHGIARRLRSTW